MKRLLWNAVAALLGMVAAVATRNLVSALWPGSAQPPLDPADRRIDWGEALAWAIASGIGAGLARLIARRGAAASWTALLDESPPGIAQ